MDNKIGLRGLFQLEHWRDGKKIGFYEFPNGITTVGKNHILDVGFHGSSATATWYIGLVDNSGFTAFADADTMSSHTGWAESTAYTEATRPAWTEGAASAGSITNSSSVDFSINATAAIKGIFITSVNTKSGTTGVLWATAAFASVLNVINGDTIKVTYTVSA